VEKYAHNSKRCVNHPFKFRKFHCYCNYSF
jgi:hypothetical protein